MSTPQVWVSARSPEIEFDGQTPGSHWQLVGTIDTNQESDFYTYIQIYVTSRSTTRGRPEFYLDGDPGSAWVQASERGSFWLAIDPWGESREYIRARPTYLVSKGQAVATSLARNPPESHPGRAKAIKVPIRLKRADGGVFAIWEQLDE
ncbi:hypothetical protein [Mycolicibacterium fluoranthenivorans]|uniref:Uncharacterized protein n=1 Tax=Mycolicibacterium fluoranthenivorans TaxID=258505 RepID=A0A1G4WKT5_9MYCO|nr:hypothetical protein [Mycolicibacterium fluoranthenivorans]SCX24786.1 hypothetical protein SAMN02799620_03778 [Mycolicibacterium fluoranthenivorans]